MTGPGDDSRPVLLTGAAGAIGHALVTRLPGLGWRLRLFDRTPLDQFAAAAGVEAALVGDVTDPAAVADAMTGVQAVVHLAGVPTEAPWPTIRDANVDGLVTLFEAARHAAVPRVVYASSNHAVGFTPVTPELPADTAPRPDTLYGVSKVFGEALGRYYAQRYGMRVACLRIGTFADAPRDVRSLSTWLSPADCALLIDAALRDPGLDYTIVWGVSANTRRTWSLAAGEAIGYRPRDDAEHYATTLPDLVPDPSDGLVGGGFTSPGFGIDEVAARTGRA